MRVVIIGAGLGGLTLAHGLRAAGIDVAVHERSPRTGPQPASYGIHVDDHGNRALHACLPGANWARYDRSTVPAPHVVRFRDAALATLTDLELGSPTADADPVAHRRAVRREPLHQALLDGLDDTVRWDSTFASFIPRPDRRVRVEFAHTMTPMAGVGANTALRDADALRRALTDPAPASLVDRVGRYESEMRAYANEALTLSTRNARNAASDRRLPRLAFRTLLRVSDAIPPVKRAVFPGTVRAGAPATPDEPR